MNPPETTVGLVDRLPPGHLEDSGIRDVRKALTAPAKTLPPKWFYDARGSELFGRITQLPEDYPTRVERTLLTEHAPQIAAASPAETLIELGLGSAEKAPLLLDALVGTGLLSRYVAVDVSATAFVQAHAALPTSHPELSMQTGTLTADPCFGHEHDPGQSRPVIGRPAPRMSVPPGRTC